VSFEEGDIHRQRIVWEKGRKEVLANRGGSDWAVSGHVLPPYGFRASVETADGVVQAVIERVGERVFEWSRSPRSLYVNARPETNGPAARASLAGVETSGACRVDVQDGQLRVTPLPDGPRFTVRLSWDELPWKLPRPAMAEAIDEQGGVIRKIYLAGKGSAIELTCEPGEFAYRLGPAK